MVTHCHCSYPFKDPGHVRVLFVVAFQRPVKMYPGFWICVAKFMPIITVAHTHNHTHKNSKLFKRTKSVTVLPFIFFISFFPHDTKHVYNLAFPVPIASQIYTAHPLDVHVLIYKNGKEQHNENEHLSQCCVVHLWHDYRLLLLASWKQILDSLIFVQCTLSWYFDSNKQSTHTYTFIKFSTNNHIKQDPIKPAVTNWVYNVLVTSTFQIKHIVSSCP